MFIGEVKNLVKSYLRSGLALGDFFRLHRGGSGPGTVQLHGARTRYSEANALLHSCREIFVDEVYKFRAIGDAPFVIDCGANIGLSILYFKRLYPKAQVLAFEPDPTLFDILRYNVEQAWKLPGVELVNKGVWHRDDTLVFHVEGALAGSLVVDFAGVNKVANVDVVNLAPYLRQRPVDFLKIDIEGAENQMLSIFEDGLANVQNFFLEYHSLPELPQCLPEYLSIAKKAGFRVYIKEAAQLTTHPFLRHGSGKFDVQLNLFFSRV